MINTNALAMSQKIPSTCCHRFNAVRMLLVKDRFLNGNTFSKSKLLWH